MPVVMIDDRRCDNAVADNGNKNTSCNERASDAAAPAPASVSSRWFFSQHVQHGHETTDRHAILGRPDRAPLSVLSSGDPVCVELRSRPVGLCESGGGGGGDKSYGSGGRSIASRSGVASSRRVNGLLSAGSQSPGRAPRRCSLPRSTALLPACSHVLGPRRHRAKSAVYGPRRHDRCASFLSNRTLNCAH